MAQYKPENYNSASPYLVVQNADGVINFLVNVFDAEPLRRYESPDGSILHAEVRIDDSVVMLGEAGGEWEPRPTHIHVYVKDAQATFDRAVAAGGEAIQEPARKGDDPDLRGGFKGPGGNTWWVGTQV